MRSALIGYTGFVGSNLNEQFAFTDTFNTQNIEEIEGREYDLVVSAGARAEKWRINQEPEKDMEEIRGLMGHLRAVKARRFVLISTVDVYKTPVAVDEDTQLEVEGLHAYGANRIKLEEFCKAEFDTLIIRLPGLFGPGLKKNVIYDLLHSNALEKIHHAGSLQYYNLANIWTDISTALERNLPIVNFANEPIRTDEIAKECFGIDFSNIPEGVSAPHYDFYTKYSELYGGPQHYMSGKEEVLADIKSYVESQRGKL